MGVTRLHPGSRKRDPESAGLLKSVADAASAPDETVVRMTPRTRWVVRAGVAVLGILLLDLLLGLVEILFDWGASR